MLKTMRKYRRSVLGIVIVAVITMTMGGFGIDLISNKSKPYAIRVGDRDISYERYAGPGSTRSQAPHAGLGVSQIIAPASQPSPHTVSRLT